MIVTWKLAKLQRADGYKFMFHILRSLCMHIFFFFPIRSFVHSFAYSVHIVEKWHRKWRQFKAGQAERILFFFYFTMLSKRFERYEFTSVHVTVHLLIKQTISVSTLLMYICDINIKSHENVGRVVCVSLYRSKSFDMIFFWADSESIYCETS